MDALLAKLTWTDVVAILGALAWLPVVVGWFQRPKITLIPGGVVEIGFTGMGAIFNPSLAFRTEKRDALVVSVSFEVQHEKGQRAVFKSGQFAETPGVTQSTTGESAIHSRVQAVRAVVLTPTTIAERKIMCQESTYQEKWDKLVDAYFTAINRIRLTVPDAGKWKEGVLQSPERHACKEFMTKALFWQAGTYRAVASAKASELRKPATATFTFTLSEADIALLTSNIAHLDGELDRILQQAMDPAAKVAPFAWHWVYPAVR